MNIFQNIIPTIYLLPSGYDIASLPWKITMLLSSVNHLFLWAMASMAMLNNQMVSHVSLDYRCPFPIGWLMKIEGFEEIPLTTGKWW